MGADLLRLLGEGDGAAFGVDLEGFDVEVGEVGAAEAGGDGDVCGVATGGHEDAADARVVVAGVHVPPAAAEPDLIPGAEVAGARGGNAYVADVAGDVAGGDVHAAGECDGEVLIVAADADAFGEDVHGGFGGASHLVIEDNFVVNPIADGGGEGPAGAEMAEEVLGDAAEAVDFAVAAGEEELKGDGGELLDGRFGKVEALQFRIAIGDDDVGSAEADGAGGREETGAVIAEAIEILIEREFGGGFDVGTDVFDLEAIVVFDTIEDGELRLDRRMEVEERHHGRGLDETELDVVLGFDEQEEPFRDGIPGEGRETPS